ncbi:MAG: CpaF family protein, partial [Sphingomonadales bacterium]
MGSGTGGRPAFGVARPMQGGAAPRQSDLPPPGGEQFPPINVPLPGAGSSPPVDLMAERDPASGSIANSDALQRLADRQATSGDAGNSRVEGFEASIHRIKEQVLPRLLERVDPEAAATLSKDELAEEFRPIIGEHFA